MKEGAAQGSPIAELMEARGDLAARVVDDLDDLLTIMLLCLDRLAVHVLPGSAGWSDLEQLRQVSRRYQALGRRLAVASLRQSSVPTEFDLGDAVRKAIQAAQPMLGPRIDLRTSLLADRVVVRADPRLVEQALIDLFQNARDAMPQGGCIKVTIRLETAPSECHGQPGAARGGPYALLTVTDSGVGIPPRVLPHIFEPFFTTKPEKSDGLGLTNVYAVMKNAGGAVTARSEPGQGTSIALAFPLEVNR